MTVGRHDSSSHARPALAPNVDGSHRPLHPLAFYTRQQHSSSCSMHSSVCGVADKRAKRSNVSSRVLQALQSLQWLPAAGEGVPRDWVPLGELR